MSRRPMHAYSTAATNDDTQQRKLPPESKDEDGVEDAPFDWIEPEARMNDGQALHHSERDIR